MKWQDQIGKIVWLENPLQYTYLRETRHDSFTSRVPIKTKVLGCMEKVVGYELLSHKPKQLFSYRIWWLKTYDRDVAPDDVYRNSCPIEAVVPSSISAGKKSRLFYPTMFGVREP